MLRLALALIVFCFATAPHQAHAQYCNFSVSDADFGNVDTLAGNAVTTTATVDITCGGALALTSVDICLGLNAGSGGATGGLRHMRNASNDPLDYAFFQDAAFLVPWGSPDSPALGDAPAVELNLPALGGEVSTSVTIYARIPGSQETAATGTYSSLFSGTAADFTYQFNLALPLLDCASPLSNTANPTFSVLADVQKNCSISADDIDFGTHGVLTAALTAEGTVTATCTPDTGYSIGLNGGVAAAPPDQRLMAFGANTIQYGLYKDAGHTQAWGDSGGDLVTGTGTGLAVPINVYGLVPAQTTPVPGAYQDTVVVTITY